MLKCPKCRLVRRGPSPTGDLTAGNPLLPARRAPRASRQCGGSARRRDVRLVDVARGVKAVATGLLIMMLAAGCEAGIALNAVRSKGSPGALNTKGSLQVIGPTCIKGFDSCESVALVNEATDLEAWAFTYQEKQRGPFGVSVGELPMTVYIVGPKNACDAVEGMATTPAIKGISEPCHGPFYFVKNR